ncbi:MAG: hypothetical protein H7318_16620 [Oligoflexus sp.]|nr:hypothetical protein [Oligoflexus sp.]
MCFPQLLAFSHGDFVEKTYHRYFQFLEWFEAQRHSDIPLAVDSGNLLVDAESNSSASLVCRLPLILRQDKIHSITSLQEDIANPGHYALILIQAGRASIAVALEDEIIYSKQIQKYMVRATQGKSQLSYLNQKGKSRLGSRIRLRQSAEFFAEIDAKLKLLNQEYDLKQLFLSCSPKLKGFWYQASSTKVFDKKDPRWRRIPFMVRPPGQVEMFRIHKLLCRSTLIYSNLLPI